MRADEYEREKIKMMRFTGWKIRFPALEVDPGSTGAHWQKGQEHRATARRQLLPHGHTLKTAGSPAPREKIGYNPSLCCQPLKIFIQYSPGRLFCISTLKATHCFLTQISLSSNPLFSSSIIS